MGFTSFKILSGSSFWQGTFTILAEASQS